MKITLSSDDFRKALDIILGAIPKQAIPSACQYARFEVEGDALRLRTGDGEMQIEMDVPLVQSDGRTAFLIGIKTLREAMHEVPTQPMTLTLDEKNRLTVAYQNGEFVIPTMAADSFPLLRWQGAYDNPITLTPALRNAIIATRNSADDKNELHPQLCCVCLDIDEPYVTVTGTTGASLYTRTVETDAKGSGRILITPAALKRLPNMTGEGCKMLWSEKMVYVEADGGRMFFVPMTTRYPNFTPLLDGGTVEAEATVDRRTLYNTVRRLEKFNGDDEDIIELTAAYNEIIVVSGGDESKAKGQTVIPCKCEGKFHVYVTAEALGAVLAAAEQEEISIRFVATDRPLFINDGENGVGLVMPLAR